MKGQEAFRGGQKGFTDEVYLKMAAVLEDAGVSAGQVARDGWSYNPKTRYFRFDKFQTTGDGGRMFNEHKKETVRIRSKVKMSPTQDKILTMILEGQE